METQSLPQSPHIAETVAVTSTAHLSDVLREASDQGRAVIPVGGGTSLHTGNVTDESYLGIDMRGMAGVREYHPTDLTASFHAGTTLGDVRDILAEHGQELPVDLVSPDTATIGGMVATGFAGPRRLGSGTLKDLIIGAEYVRGDGLVAKAGGMLVKNVSGFEIPRFLHGSWGALAVITFINLKVVPGPKADVSFTHLDGSLDASLDAQVAMLGQHPGVVALVTSRAEDGWALSARLMGRRASVDAQIQAIRDELGSETVVTEGEGPWKAYNDRWAGNDDRVVRVLIGGRSRFVRDLAHSFADHDALADLAVSLGTGTLRVALHADGVAYDSLASLLQAHEVSWTIESASACWRGAHAVWGPSRADHELAASIKAQFDPDGILNRGRLFI